MGINYKIISKPVKIECICPHCKADVTISFDEVRFHSTYWGDGATVTCPTCEAEIELDEYEYD